MSSYYTRAQLEAMRKERLRMEMNESIRRLKEQMMINHSESRVETGSSVNTTIFAEDDSIDGIVSSSGVSGNALRASKKISVEKRDALDFSSLLIQPENKPTKLEQELNNWIAKVEERPVLSEKDETDRIRVLSELARIVKDKNIDVEDKLRSVKMRVISYLSGAVKITAASMAEIESNYYEYCALCDMLQVNPTEQKPYRVKSEIVRMRSVLEKQKQDEYIMEVIEAAMEELGCHVKDDAVLDHTEGQVYAVDGNPLCDVFVGADGSGIMFEPIGESKNTSIERQRRIEESANSVCSLYKTLEEKVAEKGVILKRIYAEPIHIEQMCVQADLSDRKEQKKQKRAAKQGPKSFTMED